MSLLTTLDNAWGTIGPRMQEGGRLFAAHTGSANALITFSGTAALEAALRALCAGDPDAEVIVAAYGDPRTASVAAAVGAKVVFDKQSHILYRQHGNNTTGQGQGVIHDCKQRMRRILRKENSRYRRACELQKGFAHLFKAENAQLLTDFIKAKHSLPRRLALGCRRQLACANSTTAFLFRVALLANTY